MAPLPDGACGSQVRDGDDVIPIRHAADARWRDNQNSTMKTARFLSVLTVLLAACGGDGATAPLLPTTSVADDFERATLGPNWVVSYGQPAIFGGSDLGTNTLDRGILGWRGAFGSDQFSETVVSGGWDRNDFFQVAVRMDSLTSVRYGFLFRSDSLLYQLKYDGLPPSQVLVIDAVVGPPAQPGDTFRIEVQGTRLRGLVNGVVIAEGTHAALTSGIPGIAIAAFGTAPAVFFESWRGGTLP